MQPSSIPLQTLKRLPLYVKYLKSLLQNGDQCTGANPRCPLFSEIREMYTNAYYVRQGIAYSDTQAEASCNCTLKRVNK